MGIQRKSYAGINKIYFLTGTIHNWYALLDIEENKQLVVNYLKELSDKNLITIYAFVIMPNHVHIIWRQNNLNGKETAQGSFLKYTAHEFLKKLKASGASKSYEVNRLIKSTKYGKGIH